MRKIPLGAWTTVGCVLLLLACGPVAADGEGDATLPYCEWCGATEAPEELSWQSRIAPQGEEGEPLVLTGTVYAADGETPAPGVVIYAYHTDAKGIYRKEGGETGNAQRHGLLRGWVESDEDGRYRFDTIRPASYPDSSIAQHVHMTVLPPDGEETWINSVKFTDDPLLTASERRQRPHRGGPGLVTPERGEDGTWHAQRDIVLPP